MSDLKINETASTKMDYPNEVCEICRQDNQRLIASLAYARAQSRGFEPGKELEDWLLAEEEAKKHVDWE